MINLGYMEDIGLGIPKVYDSMKKHNNTEPEFYVRDHDFIATLISL
jgi:predicted HTH transcriptional regulator